MLCITLTGHTMKENQEMFWRNRQYIAMAELRIDCLDTENRTELEKARSFPEEADVPVILTCRRKQDGGLFEGTERKRLGLLKTVSKGSFSYVDIEADVRKQELEDELRSRKVSIIKSIHDFSQIPDNIFALASKLAGKGYIPKLAVTPRSVQDLMLLFRCESELSSIKEKIIVGMGPYGTCTRILYRRLGSMLSFCSENPQHGQLSPMAMSELYRADRVNAQTRIYGVVGNPIAHSSSPNIHNPGFRGIRFNAIYVPFLADNIRTFFKLAELLRINGFSVTVPFKKDVIPYLGKTTREVRQTGTCNTVVREHSLWKGSNTDYYGFLNLVETKARDRKIRSAIVIGAGGAARAVVYALRSRNIQVTILNRTEKNAMSLALETMSSYDSLENASRYSNTADLVVQATSVGLDNLDADPVPSLEFSGKEMVCDLVYKPHRTRLLTRASDKGCAIIYGIEMLLEQGKLQFEAFTGYHYPPNVRPEL